MPEGFIGRWSRLKKSQEPSHEHSHEPSQELFQEGVKEFPEESVTQGLAVENVHYAVPKTSFEDEQPTETLSALDRTDLERVDTASEAVALEGEEEISEAPPVLTDIDMPDLSTINSTSDMSMFFSGGVSVELRRKALRTFFHQPEFNFRDPLDDYALDYSQPKKLVLKVGDTVRGWAHQQMDDAMQQARDALLKTEPTSEAMTEESLESDIEEVDADSTNVDEADQRGKNESA